MASCAKEEIVDVNVVGQTNAISFDLPYVGTSSKAGVVTTANVGSVGVFAYTTGTGATDMNDDGAASNSLAIINNTKLSVEIDGTAASSATYYWDATDVEGGTAKPFDFYAYYPFVGTADLGAYAGDGNTGDLVHGVLTSDAFDIATTADAQVDILAGADVASTIAGNTVALTMNHMLSKVDFQVGVQSEKIAGNLVLELQKVELLGIEGTQAGLDLAGQAMKYTADNKTSYTYLTDGYFYSGTGTGATSTTPMLVAGALTATYGAVNAASTAAVTPIEAFMLLPQTLNAADNVADYQTNILCSYVFTQGVNIDGGTYEACVVAANTDAEATAVAAAETAGLLADVDTTSDEYINAYNSTYASTYETAYTVNHAAITASYTALELSNNITNGTYADCVEKALADNATTFDTYARVKLTYRLKQGNVYISGSSTDFVTGTFVLPTTTTIGVGESDVSVWEAGHSYLYSILFSEANVNTGDGPDDDDDVYKIEFSITVSPYNEFYTADAN